METENYEVNPLSPSISISCKESSAFQKINSTSIDNALAIQMAARIYRASVNELDIDLDEILGSSEFQAFCRKSGSDISCLTPYFDCELYLDRFQMHNKFEVNPVLHFCRFGKFHGTAPSLLFDANYLRAQLGWAPPRTFEINTVKSLTKEGEIASCQASDVVDLFVAILENTSPPYLNPHPLFDSELWACGCSDLKGQHPVVSFLTTDNFSTHPFSPYFSIPFVTKRKPFLHYGIQNPLLIYLRNLVDGKIDDVNPMFHSLYYLDISGVHTTDPLSYYLVEGVKEGVPPNPFADIELAITDFDRISGLFQKKYLDYLRCNSNFS